MLRSRTATTLALVLLASALLAAAPRAPEAAPPAPVPPGADSVLAARGVKKGYLFSAVALGDSSLGVTWGPLRSDAASRFPDLKLTQVPDLHITVVYVGGEWRSADLPALRAGTLVPSTGTAHTNPEVVRMGRNQQVVAVELKGAPAAWTDSVIAAKRRMNALGLKKPDSFDDSFRTHVTLAEARHNPPSDAENTQLAAFLPWIAEQVAHSPERWSITIGPRTPVVLLLAGAARPEGGPEYVTVDDFLARQLQPAR